MSNPQQDNNNNIPNPNYAPDSTTVRTGGNRPRTIHVAHRRSPSELTTLMLEQFNLQRQLEIVQAQQQQILQQQQQQMSQPGGNYPQSQGYNNQGGAFNFQSVLMPPPGGNSNQKRGSGHHRRSSSNISNPDNAQDNSFQSPRNHRRAQSSVASANYGHNRRHSLGLSEAKRAAAEAQAQRQSPSKLSISSTSMSETPSDSNTLGGQSNATSLMAPPSFKFPPSPKLSTTPDDGFELSRGHSRTRSSLSTTNERSPQRSFQFPPRDNSNTLAPPAPNFSGGRQSLGNINHRSTASDMSNNWRKQQPSTPNQSLSYAAGTFEPPSFTPSHRPRGSYGGSVSSISQFNQSQNGQQRKSLFAPYLPQNSLPELINEGRLVTGTLRVNKKNRSDAYISTDGLLDADIFICGSKDRNRALEGDLVAIELLVVDEVWNSKREKEEKKRRKDNISTRPGTELSDDLHNDASTSYSSSAGGNTSNSTDSNNNSRFDSSPSSTAPSSAKTSGSLNRRGSLKQRPTQKKNDDVEVEGQSLLLVEEEEISDEFKPLYAGHVVAVVDRIPGQLFSGTLGLLRPSQAAKEARENKDKDKSKDSASKQNNRPKIVWFKPTDKKVPLIAIPTEQAPKDFVENHEKYNDQVFIASIKRWPITSLHPFGTMVSKLGKMNEAEVEVDSLLRDNNFLCDEYPDDESKYMTDIADIKPALASGDRKDFSGEYVIAFSQTGVFSDHALHVKIISESKIELGIHIADATYYIKQDSSLDKRSKKRSHSVFLPQKAVNLFPPKVNDLISFKEGEKGLALSIVFEIDSATFDIDDVWMGESIIEPKQRVDYSVVDSILNKTYVEKGTNDATSGYITTLSLISRGLRRRRLNNPDLNIEPILPLLDQLDDERVKLSLNIFDTIPSTSMIDEIFHNVNAAIAQRVHAALGDRALLRKYPIPTLTKFEAYSRKVANLGIELDTTNASTFQNSLLNIKDPIKRNAVETILIKCMPRGKYVIAGKTDADGLGHYLFNLPSYTHFTAPLRRYADIIVHRQFKAVIKGQAESYRDDIDSLKMNSDYCNFKKDCAKAAQEQAIHLLLCQSINEMSKETGQILCMGTILQVYESSFDVILPEFGIEKRVHGDQLPLRKAEFDKTNRVLELYWEPGVDAATYVPEDERKPLSYRASIKNKYRSTSKEAASTQSSIPQSLIDKFSKLNLSVPHVKSLESKGDSLSPYLKECITRIDGENYIQEIRELQKVPILLKSEVGMTLPCLTVRTLNPFAEVKKN